MSNYRVVEGIEHEDNSYSAGEPLTPIDNPTLICAIRTLMDHIPNGRIIHSAELGMFKHLPGACALYVEIWKEGDVAYQRSWLIRKIS